MWLRIKLPAGFLLLRYQRFERSSIVTAAGGEERLSFVFPLHEPGALREFRAAG
jgi:hypothetical protein